MKQEGYIRTGGLQGEMWLAVERRRSHHERRSACCPDRADATAEPTMLQTTDLALLGSRQNFYMTIGTAAGRDSHRAVGVAPEHPARARLAGYWTGNLSRHRKDCR